MQRKPKIGDRARWTSLDDSVPSTVGTVTEVSPSGKRFAVTWDEDGETYSYDLHPASQITLL